MEICEGTNALWQCVNGAIIQEQETEQEDDFDKIYRGEISKSGAAILPSKRTRRIPEKVLTESKEEDEKKQEDVKKDEESKNDSLSAENKAE